MVGRLRTGNAYVVRGNSYRIADAAPTDCCCGCVQELFLREPVVEFTRNSRTYTSGDDGTYFPCTIWGVPSTYDVGFAITYGHYQNRASIWCQFLEDDSALSLTLSADPAFNYTFQDLRTFPETYTGVNPAPALHDITAQEMFSTDASCTPEAIAGWDANSFTAWHIEELTPYDGWTGFGESGPICNGTEATRDDCLPINYSTFYTVTVNKLWRIVRVKFFGSPCTTLSVGAGSCDIGLGQVTAQVTNLDEYTCLAPSETDYVANIQATVAYLETVTYSMPDVGTTGAATLLHYASELNPIGRAFPGFLGQESLRKSAAHTYRARTPGTTGYVPRAVVGDDFYFGIPEFVKRTYTTPNSAETFALSEEPGLLLNTSVFTDQLLIDNGACIGGHLNNYDPIGQTGLRAYCINANTGGEFDCDSFSANEPEEFAIATLDVS